MKRLVFVLICAVVLLMPYVSFAQTDAGPIEYTIRKGDTFKNLAPRFETTVNALIKQNPAVKPENLIVGSTISVQPSSNVIVHKVVRGDTLSKISTKYKVAMNIIAKKNYIKNKNKIYLGDTLAIPKTITTKLYFIKSEPTEFKLVAESRKVSTIGDVYGNTMKEFVKGPRNTQLSAILNKNTVIYSVNLVKGIAYVDCSSDILRSNLGSSGEALALNAIANTLTEYPEIKGVLLFVEGKRLESLAGHIVIEEPLRRDLSEVTD